MLAITVLTCGYIYVMTSSNNNNEASVVIIYYIFYLMWATIAFTCTIYFTTRRFTKIIMYYLDAKNKNVFNPRGLHWTVGA